MNELGHQVPLSVAEEVEEEEGAEADGWTCLLVEWWRSPGNERAGRDQLKRECEDAVSAGVTRCA